MADDVEYDPNPAGFFWDAQEHPAVARVYHPSVESKDLYDEWKRDGSGGYGSLFSVVLKEELGEVAPKMFYDRLDVAKGPGFGTNFTLVCPYTLLAHYHELEFARAYDVRANLIRVAVGLEDLDVLRDTFAQALDGARLYPKLKQKKAAAGGGAMPVVDASSSRKYHTVIAHNTQTRIHTGRHHTKHTHNNRTVNMAYHHHPSRKICCSSAGVRCASSLLRNSNNRVRNGNPRQRFIGLAGGMLLSSAAATCIIGGVM